MSNLAAPPAAGKKTTYPKSDALGPGDYFSTCPKCGNEALDVRAARGLGLLGVLGALFTSKR